MSQYNTHIYRALSNMQDRDAYQLDTFLNDLGIETKGETYSNWQNPVFRKYYREIEPHLLEVLKDDLKK